VRTLSFDELAAADDRTRRFTSLGLSMSGLLTPAACAEFQQRVVAGADLVAEVPEGTRRAFDRLREFHAYGVVCYDLFTLADELTWIVLEQALRERFFEFYGGAMPIVDGHGRHEEFEAPDFGAISDAFGPGGSHWHRGWRLGTDRTNSIPVPLTLAPLLRWARRVGLLDGQRNRRLQLRLYPARRNHFVHGSSYRLGTPVQSARSICDLAEVVNRLWRHSTPGGRLYPAPLDRAMVVLGWSSGWEALQVGSTWAEMTPDQLHDQEDDDWTYVMVLAVPTDQGLASFDSRFELTAYGVDLLWGPGSRREALTWLGSHTGSAPSAAVYLDRLFAIRRGGGEVARPRRPEVLLALPDEERGGEWDVVRADFPMDAFGHVQHSEAGEGCPDARYGGCAVEEIAHGPWEEAVAAITRLQPAVVPARYSTAAVSPRWSFLGAADIAGPGNAVGPPAADAGRDEASG
jgi:hypothetical protein